MSPSERARLAEWCEEQARHRDVMMRKDRLSDDVGIDERGRPRKVWRSKFMSWLQEGDDFRALAKFLREAEQ